MLGQLRLVLGLCLTFSWFAEGWEDDKTESDINPADERPFKLNGLEDSLPNTNPKARRELGRRRPRGKYRFNLKRVAIRQAKNRNALCLGKWLHYNYCGIAYFCSGV